MSLQASEIEAVEKIVSVKMDAEEMFTAFNVTLEAQMQGVHRKNVELRDIIHMMYERGNMPDYTRTLKDIPGAPAPAWVYHPEHMSADDFMPLDRTGQRRQKQATAIQVAQAAMGASPKAPVATAPQPTAPVPAVGAHVPDGRGRVCVPVEMVKSLGLVKGDDVYVAVNTERLEVTKGYPTADVAVIGYVVDPRGNIRVSKQTLDRAQFKCSEFNIVAENGTVVITPK